MGELSQQPTFPHFWHMRRWTQLDPIFRHSSQPPTPGGGASTSIWSRCEQTSATSAAGLVVAEALGREPAGNLEKHAVQRLPLTGGEDAEDGVVDAGERPLDVALEELAALGGEVDDV